MKLVSIKWGGLLVCLFPCLLLFISGCRKTSNSETLNVENDFFLRNEVSIINGVKSNSTLKASNEPDIVDSLITALKAIETKTHASKKISSKYGTPKWNNYLTLKNSNGKRTIVIPIYKKSESKIEMIMFFYEESNQKFIVKFVNRKNKSDKLKVHGDKEGTVFTKATLEGIFNAMDENVKENNVKVLQNEIIKIKSDATYIFQVCWYYSYSKDMNSYYTSNTQCATRVVITPESFGSLPSGQNEGLPDENLNTGGGGSAESQLTEEQKLDLLYLCNCDCPEEDMLTFYLNSYEPKWGQLGDKSTMNIELVKAGIINQRVVGASNYRTGMSVLKNHFNADRLFTTNSYGDLVDRPESKKVDRYFFTTKRGWIDMYHFFVTATYAEMANQTSTFVFTTIGEVIQGIAPNNYSGFSYEDMASNHAGAEFYLLYSQKIKDSYISITDAINDYFTKIGIESPSVAPNYIYIPHIIDSYVAKSISTTGLTGQELYDAVYAAYCKKPQNTKDAIKKAHKTIKPSSN